MTEACLDDYNGIMALFKRHDIPRKKYAEWKHLWQGNPILKEENKSWPQGWVLKDSGKIVGYLGNIPLEYFFQGKRLIAAAAHVWVVDEAFRQYSVLLINNYFRQEKADFLINTTGGNPVTRKIFLAYKARKIPALLYDQAQFSILDYPAFIKSVLMKKGIKFWRKFCFFTAPLSFFIRIGVRVRNIAQYVGDIGCKAKKCDQIDDQFDEFWQELSKQKKRLFCTRDSAWIRWRYKYALADSKVWIYTIEDNCQMIAYAIFMRDDKPELELKRVRLVDLQMIEETPSLVFKLLAAAERRCRKEGVHMLESVGFLPVKRQSISRWLPHKRDIQVWPFYKTDNTSLDNEFQDLDVWDPCLYDGDGSF